MVGRNAHAVLENAPDAVVGIDSGGRISEWNAQAERIFGWTKAEALGRELLETLIPAKDRDAHRQVLTGQFLDRRVEIEAMARDGRVFPIELAITAIKSPGGVECYAFIRDITMQKRMHAELEQARQSALQASKLKSDFLANMSHEIRTPLNGVLGTVDLLATTPLNNEQARYLETIVESGNTLLSLINDILDFSKIEAGKMALEISDFSLLDVVEAQAELLSAKAREKKLTFVSFVSPDLPRRLRGDPGRLAQILLNLCGNALKFTENGGVTVRAEPAGAVGEGHPIEVRFSVADTGIGLSSEDSARLFEPFTQADGSTVRKYGGTGLGLSICKRLVELMGGRIGVDSQAGQGANFWFVVPLEASALQPEADGAALRGRDLRVLVVDDDPDTREILGIYLDSWGIPFDCVTGAEQALRALRQAGAGDYPYDTAFIDYNLGGRDGLALAKAIQAEPDLPPMRLLMTTAEFSKELEDQARALGVTACLPKPFKAAELLASLTESPRGKTGVGTRARRPVDQAAAGGARKRVLVVEDNPVNQRVTVGQVEKLGYQARVVANGAEAVAVLKQYEFDLVLMDCQMPEMDGFEATREIRRLEASNVCNRTPIVGLTANAMKGDDEKCLEAGMDDYIPKPVKMTRLGEVLRRWA